MALSKTERRTRIKMRIRKIINGTTDKPRLTVFRSNKEIYAQIIDDSKGVTITSASSREKDFPGDQKMNKTEQAKVVGKMIAEKAVNLGVSAVVFDRNGYLYHGRVKALAESARGNGLQL
ncbi:MAG: 50S ribosomal protein L18 [Bacteroidetes bacterium]|nr:50S ribosomal protein L18 [Bacteroidota bacterium]